MEKKIAVIASFAGIFGAGFAVYSHVTGQEPDQQMINLIIEERQRHKELIGVLRAIAEKENPINLAKSSEPIDESGKIPCGESVNCGADTNIKQNVIDTDCTVDDADTRIIVPALNVRSGPANFSYLAAWIGAVKEGDTIRIIDRKSSGPFGLGTDWIKIVYCNETQKTGWISTKLEGGAPTVESINHIK